MYLGTSDLPDFLVFLFGLACFVVAIRWPPQPGKKIFVAFVGIAFLLIPLVRLASWPLLSMLEGISRQRTQFWTFSYVPLVTKLLSIVAALLLLIYVVIRNEQTRNEQTGVKPTDASAVAYRSFRLAGSTELRFLDLGPKWDLKGSNKNRVSIARRREWAFLIDFSPVFVWLILFAFDGAAAQWGLKLPGWLNSLVLTLTILSVPVALAYWVFKDGVGGVSLGKWLTKCRVVCNDSGRPIGAGKSAIRNFVFLIPCGALIELVVFSLRHDGRRLGDLIAGTTVVMGPPKWIDGVEVESAGVALTTPISTPHPLDD